MILAAKESEHLLIANLFHKVDEIRHKVATTINTGITLMHWHIGEHINKNILHEKRAEYGKKYVSTMSTKLPRLQGRSTNTKSCNKQTS